MNLENQKQIEGNVRQYYEILRSRQLQIIGIIKDTTELLEKINSSPNLSESNNQILETNLDNGMQLAFGMINALANILDEQMKALNIWERLLIDETAHAAQQSKVDYEYQDYYEIRAN
jgi:hypothetical protein